MTKPKGNKDILGWKKEHSWVLSMCLPTVADVPYCMCAGLMNLWDCVWECVCVCVCVCVYQRETEEGLGEAGMRSHAASREGGRGSRD